jgi:hypothetical protein
VKFLYPKAIVDPDKNEVLCELDLKKLQTMDKSKSLLCNGFCSLATEIWDANFSEVVVI